jgi:hypothetical protein
MRDRSFSLGFLVRGFAKRAVNAGGHLIRGDDPVRAILIEHEFRLRFDDVRIAYQCKRPIIEDQPLSIHVGSEHRVVFVWHNIMQDDYLHIVTGESGLP